LKKKKIVGKTWFIYEPLQSLNVKGRTRINEKENKTGSNKIHWSEGGVEVWVLGK